MQNTRSQGLYRTLWRWHFYAGLFCIPFILILALSGAIYLFKPQLEQWREAPYTNLTAGSISLPNQQIAAALDSIPTSQFRSYRLPRAENDAVRISVQANGQPVYVYVNPYSLEILHTTPIETVFIEWVKDLHGELMVGRYGSWLVELAACWAIVLVVTGVYLGWPKNSQGLGGILYPRWQLKGRMFWKDLHSVIGLWLSLLVLFLLITGLPWTSVWGTAFKESRALISEIQSKDWSLSKEAQTQSWRIKAVTEYHLSPETLTQAMAMQFAWPSELSVSNSQTNEWKLASLNQNRPLRETAWLNGDEGKVLRVKQFKDKPTLDKAISIGIAAHEGQLFGWLNQALGVITAAGLWLLSLSGLVMWYKRKPSGQLGSPKPLPEPSHSKVLLGTLIVAAICLPLLGLSLIIMALLEYTLLRRIPVINQWLGLSHSLSSE